LERKIEFRDVITTAIPSIISWLDDTSVAAQAGAATALGKFAKHAEFQDAISAVIPTMIPLLAVHDTSWEAKRARADVVTAFGDFSRMFSK
ncbi:hypothetical protein M408DRAFT_30160, partial [Serendipita vermifera MAFF 305830]